MKRFWLAALCLFCIGAVAAEIPVIDFFKRYEVRSMQISPDGKHVAFTFEKGDELPLAVMNLATKKITASFEFGEQQQVRWFRWVKDERVLMAVGKVTGNLDTNYYRPQYWYTANADGSDRRRVHDAQTSGYRVIDDLPNDPKNILIGKYHWSDETGVKAHLLNVYNGRIDYIADQPKPSEKGYMSWLGTDTNGAIRAGFEWVDAETENYDDNYGIIHLKHGDEWRKLTVPSVRERPEINPIGFSEDNTKVYFLSNHDMESGDRSGLFQYDFGTGKFSLVYRHQDVDLQGGIYGHRQNLIGVNLMPGAWEKQYVNLDATDTLFLKSLDKAFPGQYVSVTSYTTNGALALVRVFSDRNPGEFYLFDVKKMSAKFLAAALPHIRAKDMQPMEAISFAARDGLKIHGQLTRAKGANGPSPMVLVIHGGPYQVQDYWGFDPEVQLLASRGYAVLQVNYRGSAGYGDDFYRKGRMEWGHKMQDDVTDATLWAVEQGIADRERLCIYGGSYGGYAALQGVIREPDLYKCAIGFVGVYDMVWKRDGDGSDGDGGDRDQRRDMENWFNAHIGDDREALRKISPVHNVDKIKAELFIVHGEDDVRVPVGHAYRLRDALEKIGKKYEWLIVEGEGHGFIEPKNNELMFNQVLAFLDKHIGKAKK